jgi:hypothetical protein
LDLFFDVTNPSVLVRVAVSDPLIQTLRGAKE